MTNFQNLTLHIIKNDNDICYSPPGPHRTLNTIYGKYIVGRLYGNLTWIIIIINLENDFTFFSSSSSNCLQ